MTRPALLLALLLAASACAEQRKLLYEGRSPYTQVYVTEDAKGLRYLQFERDGALQSVVRPGEPRHLELAYARGAMTALAFVPSPRRVLIVGLGGGTMPMFLRSLYPSLHIDVVDIDPEVVKVARRFFGLREDARLRVHVADGRRFIEQSRGGYDLIFLDAYGPDSIPYHLATREFLAAVQRALGEGGLVVSNVWASPNPLYTSMLRTYQAQFPSVQVLDLRGSVNRIVFARSAAPAPGLEALAKRGSALSREHGLSFDLGELLTRGLRGISTQEARLGRVLLDAQDPARQQPQRKAQ
ncbi:MAG TPA: fused MFS/spermidine synthase [Aggregicoccus sp.]|nr:fused MFS/spermidine synthase [Aggregicoccus sp.]